MAVILVHSVPLPAAIYGLPHNYHHTGTGLLLPATRSMINFHFHSITANQYRQLFLTPFVPSVSFPSYLRPAFWNLSPEDIPKKSSDVWYSNN